MAGQQVGSSPRNNTDDRELYSVGEVCDMAGTTRKTLFYYDRIGLLTPTKREGVQKFKQYDSGKVRRLRKILEYRDAGLSIAEVRKLLDDRNANHLEVMQEALSRMLKEKAAAEKTISKLEALIRKEQNRDAGGSG